VGIRFGGLALQWLVAAGGLRARSLPFSGGYFPMVGFRPWIIIAQRGMGNSGWTTRGRHHGSCGGEFISLQEKLERKIAHEHVGVEK